MSSEAIARSYGMRGTERQPDARIWLARSAIQLVESEPAGPPCGGLYLKPPSVGGLCDGVTTMPSARGPSLSRLYTMIARDTAGVGVYSFSSSARTSTPLATSTSSAVFQAGNDRPWVS